MAKPLLPDALWDASSPYLRLDDRRAMIGDPSASWTSGISIVFSCYYYMNQLRRANKMKFNHFKKCKFGLMLFNSNDKFVGRSLDLYGEYSHGEADLFRQIVRAGDVVVEVGANYGAHTLQLAQLAGPHGAVYAFEPQRLPFQVLCANMALNSISNVDCRQQAVGREVGSLTVPRLDPGVEQNFGGVSLENIDHGDQICMITVDCLSLDECRFIKIDVEGMELDVLLGAAETIRRHRPLLYVENDRRDRSSELVLNIAGLGYEIYWHRPPLFNPQNYFQNPVNVFGQLVSANLLCIHQDERIKIQGFDRIVIQKS